MCMSASLCKLTQRENPKMYSPQDAITGSSGCLAIDLMLPEHLPKKQPNNFPVMKYIHYYQNIEEKKNSNHQRKLMHDISNIKKSILTFAFSNIIKLNPKRCHSH